MTVYRIHISDPIPFTRSIRVTIEHGHANSRSDNFYSASYWYQTEPHTPFPALPAVETRLPTLMMTGGPGNGPQPNVAPPPQPPPAPIPGVTPSVATPPGSTTRTQDSTTTPATPQQQTTPQQPASPPQ